MVQRLKVIIAVTLLSGCSTSLAIPPAISEYCQVAGTHYPLLLSRQDTPETKRRVASANAVYEKLCNVKEMK